MNFPFINFSFIRTPRFSLLILFTITCLSLTACGLCPPRIYRMDVRQGNYITGDMVCQLREGLSKDAVVQIMGAPMLDRFFERNRWDYYYYLKPGNGAPCVTRHIIIYFKGDRICRLEDVC